MNKNIIYISIISCLFILLLFFSNFTGKFVGIFSPPKENAEQVGTTSTAKITEKPTTTIGKRNNYCGDKTCDSDESCSLCSIDCGICEGISIFDLVPEMRDYSMEIKDVTYDSSYKLDDHDHKKAIYVLYGDDELHGWSLSIHEFDSEKESEEALNWMLSLSGSVEYEGIKEIGMYVGKNKISQDVHFYHSKYDDGSSRTIANWRMGRFVYDVTVQNNKDSWRMVSDLVQLCIKKYSEEG